MMNKLRPQYMEANKQRDKKKQKETTKTRQKHAKNYRQ
jgi:hypothetical protein